jgi:hypothetical protein
VTAVEWEGTADMDYATTGSMKFEEINTAERIDESDVYAIEDADFYALGTSDLSLLNKVQNCQAKLPVEKQGADSDIFTTYTAYLQARIY